MAPAGRFVVAVFAGCVPGRSDIEVLVDIAEGVCEAPVSGYRSSWASDGRLVAVPLSLAVIVVEKVGWRKEVERPGSTWWAPSMARTTQVVLLALVAVVRKSHHVLDWIDGPAPSGWEAAVALRSAVLVYPGSLVAERLTDAVFEPYCSAHCS